MSAAKAIVGVAIVAIGAMIFWPSSDKSHDTKPRLLVNKMMYGDEPGFGEAVYGEFQNFYFYHRPFRSKAFDNVDDCNTWVADMAKATGDQEGKVSRAACEIWNTDIYAYMLENQIDRDPEYRMAEPRERWMIPIKK